jgi:hypothetical protein
MIIMGTPRHVMQPCSRDAFLLSLDASSNEFISFFINKREICRMFFFHNDTVIFNKKNRQDISYKHFNRILIRKFDVCNGCTLIGHM